MSDDIEVRWDRLTAPELRDPVKDRTVVIIPLGATEQHGPHLPVQVDWRSAYEISLRAARLMAGRLTIEGVNPGTFRWQHLRTRSAVGVLGEAWAATPEKGQRLLAAISQDVADALAEQRLCDAPI